MGSLASSLRACVTGLALAIVPFAALAVDVFVATLRAPSGSTEAGGHLYRVDVATRSSTLVGRIMVDGTQPVGLTGMAFHPKTKVLYAITLGVNDAKRATLLTVDPHTAEARVIGRLSRPLTDISFDPAGRLYGWTADTGQLAIVDIHSAKVSPIGAGGPGGGGAFAIDRGGNAFVATWSEPGTLDRVDLEGGVVAPGPAVSNLPDVSTLRSMAFSGQGELFATHSVRAGAASSVLLRIDPRTGQAAAIGDIPEDSEAIAVRVQEFADRSDILRWIAHAAIGAMLLGLAWLYFRRHRHVPRAG